MNLRPLLDYLEENNVGTIGRDLFMNHLPDGVQNGVAIFSQKPVEIHMYLKVRHGSFQIVGRGNNEEELIATMNSVFDAFEEGEGMTLGDMKFYFIRPEHEPFYFPRSESDLIEASVSFAFSYSQQT